MTRPIVPRTWRYKSGASICRIAGCMAAPGQLVDLCYTHGVQMWMKGKRRKALMWRESQEIDVLFRDLESDWAAIKKPMVPKPEFVPRTKKNAMRIIEAELESMLGKDAFNGAEYVVNKGGRPATPAPDPGFKDYRRGAMRRGQLARSQAPAEIGKRLVSQANREASLPEYVVKLGGRVDGELVVYPTQEAYDTARGTEDRMLIDECNRLIASGIETARAVEQTQEWARLRDKVGYLLPFSG